MVDAWWDDVAAHGLDQVRMLASRHNEVWMLNQLARVRMRHAGHLTGPAIANRWGLEFQAGDRIVVRDNWYAHADLRNGQTGTVTAVSPDTRTLTFRRDVDGEIIELPKRYLDRNVDHAYAQTIHTAQGQTFEITHAYADTGVRAEYGYTALSRARGETHIWVNDAPGPLGESTCIHASAVTEDPIDGLVRRLRRSIVEPPAHDHGLPVHDATDQQLIAWRNELAAQIRRSPLATDPTDELHALEAAITHAAKAADRIGTSGAKAQVQALQARRDHLAQHPAHRQSWLQDRPGILHRYSAVAEEIQHRINGRVAAYQLDPPEDVCRSLGVPQTDGDRHRRWTEAVVQYAEARMTIGPTVNLQDPSVLAAAVWRQAVSRSAALPEPSVPKPALRRVPI